MKTSRTKRRLTDQEIQLLLDIHAANPELTSEQVVGITLIQVSPMTVKKIWRAGSIGAYKNFLEKMKLDERERTKRRKEEKKETGILPIINDDMLPTEDLNIGTEQMEENTSVSINTLAGNVSEICSELKYMNKMMLRLLEDLKIDTANL